MPFRGRLTRTDCFQDGEVSLEIVGASVGGWRGCRTAKHSGV